MSSFAAYQAEHRRLELLRALAAAAGYRANAQLLRQYLEHVGHAASAEHVQADLAWLRDSALIELDEACAPAVATLTVRGLDVAAARTHVAGVARPLPGG